MIFVVLGMHKSGTTLISEMLHHSGINMGEFDETVTYQEGNQYERHATQEINKSLLHCGDMDSLDVLRVADIPSVDDPINDTMSQLIDDLNASGTDWGFKDPRTCLTFPIWELFLPPTYKLICVYRSPVEVWHHYRKRISRYRIFKRLRHGYKALKAWHVYNTLLLKYLRTARQQYCIVNYGRFMEESPSLTTLAAFVGCPLTDSRETGLYRSKAPRGFMYRICTALLSITCSPHVDKLYSYLERERQQSVDNQND